MKLQAIRCGSLTKVIRITLSQIYCTETEQPRALTHAICNIIIKVLLVPRMNDLQNAIHGKKTHVVNMRQYPTLQHFGQCMVRAMNGIDAVQCPKHVKDFSYKKHVFMNA